MRQKKTVNESMSGILKYVIIEVIAVRRRGRGRNKIFETHCRQAARQKLNLEERSKQVSKGRLPSSPQS